MASRAALTILMVMLVSAVAEAKNYRKYNNPYWGSRWKQTLKIRDVNFQPFIGR